jgi:hypothetical protein
MKLLTGARTVKLCGMDFTMVNELPEEAIRKLAEVLPTYHNSGGDYDVLRRFLKYLGGGYCGVLFHLTEDLVLKVESGNYHGARDGKMLHELQGLPFIPKVYLYNEKHNITVIEKVKGCTVREYIQGGADFTLLNWDTDTLLQQVKDMIQESYLQRRVTLGDLHSSNLMVDKEGNFWVVDAGCFEKVSGFLERRLEEAGSCHSMDNAYRDLGRAVRAIGERVNKLDTIYKVSDWNDMNPQIHYTEREEMRRAQNRIERLVF